MDVLAACQTWCASLLLAGLPPLQCAMHNRSLLRLLVEACHTCVMSEFNGLQDLSFLEVPCTGAFLGTATGVATDNCRAGCEVGKCSEETVEAPLSPEGSGDQDIKLAGHANRAGEGERFSASTGLGGSAGEVSRGGRGDTPLPLGEEGKVQQKCLAWPQLCCPLIGALA